MPPDASPTRTTAQRLRERLGLVHQWYQGMIRRDTGMLEYLYVPSSDRFVRDRSPIRDIASVWDLELIGAVLNRHELDGVTRKSLSHYTEYLVERNNDLILDPIRLGEPSSIAHSAFMILALLHAPPPRDVGRITRLADGLAHQQRSDGSYQVYFADFPDSGEELYAGEAMLALVEAYRQLNDARYLESAERAVAYYDAQYFRPGRVADDLLVYFANWQSQACRPLFESTPRASVKEVVATYLARMHDRIISRGFYDDVERRPARQVSVEVACAVEGLNDAYAVTRASGIESTERYRLCICTGLGYLLRLQCTRDGTERERGGFGLSLDDRTQRIDITGHAASAFIKSLENGIECPPTAP